MLNKILCNKIKSTEGGLINNNIIKNVKTIKLYKLIFHQKLNKVISMKHFVVYHPI